MDPYTGVIAWNSFEGGTDGTTLTLSPNNTGGASGTPLAPQILGTGTLTFESTGALHDDMSCLVNAVGGICAVRWNTDVIGNLTTPCAVIHINFPTALPSAYSSIMEGKQTDGGALAWRISVSSLGNVRLINAAGAAVASTSSQPITVGNTYRVEVQVNHTTGAYGVQVFDGDSTTALATLSGTSAAAFGTSTQQVVFGRSSTPDYTALIDSIAVDTGPLGPRQTANTPPTANAGTDITNGQTGVAVSRTGTSSDSDGTVVAHEWICSVYPSGSSAPTLSGASTATVSFTPSTTGVYVLEYRVQDDDGAWSDYDAVTVYVPSTTISVRTTSSNPGGWTNVGGASSLSAAMNDSSDSTYAQSSIGTADPSRLFMRLNPLYPPTAFDMDVKHALSASGSGYAYVRLYDSDGTTVRKTWTLSPSTTAATTTLSLTGGEIGTVTSWLNLAVEFEWGT